ncbi:dephospho-CoA kinase [Leptospirillum ferriphilum]|uniref:Dephospho-CoA kinase n=1 Tax=Leptospirillum ferriphilum TaxID=178606 RepID=A0A1V3SUH6_9BACT|nr:dephospho-CoA kinase [Nitrospirota bacterium]OOH71954.1 dephospho-CoA kinase [Leptospirillum ferriphilum]OOH79624.1 dephospho-CoA kinase [Leptospirillum ferriphilum]
MRVIGLTGGIASGKSHVARFFEAAGTPVIHSDQLAREVVLPGTPSFERVREAFPDVFLDDGTLDRKALGKRIFSSQEDRKKLESILHPPIRELFMQKLGELEKKSPLAVYEVPLLFETGLDREVDLSVVVDVPEDLQILRLSKRDQMTPEEARRRISVQMPREERIRKADLVLPGDLSEEELKERVAGILVLASSMTPKRSYGV